MYRDHTKVVHIGDCAIGGGNLVAIQSMTNTKTEDVAATVAQIHTLEDLGCDIIRCAVPTMQAAEALEQIKKQIAELEGHDLFAGLDNIVFGSLELEGLIQDNETFREVGIKNGSRVVMV